MKTPFKEGDRVAVWGYADEDARTDVVFCNGTHGTVVSSNYTDSPHEINVQPDSGKNNIQVHPKQCRRLVKKPGRRVWIFVPHWGTYTEQNPAHAYPVRPCENHSEDWREFVEVRKRK